MKKNKINILAILSVISLSGIASCSNNTSFLLEVNEETKDRIYNLNIEPKMIVPGKITTYYGFDTLIQGFSSRALNPNDNEDRLYTYLREYTNNSNKYYLVYFNEDWILKNLENREYTYEKSAIDGYFINLYRKENQNFKDEDIKIYEVKKEDISKVDYKINNYFLNLVAVDTSFTFTKNLSTKEEVNKKYAFIEQVNSCELKGNKVLGIDINYKEYIKKISANIKDLNKIEPYKEIDDALTFTIKTVNNKEVISLPRYMTHQLDKYDLLDEKTEFNDGIRIYDYYGDYKELFLEALIKEDENNDSKAYFDLDILIEKMK